MKSIFKQDSQYVEALSDVCIDQLTLEDGDESPSEWVKEGAGPKLENFCRMNITPLGLLITFDEYQVGPYVQGARFVNILKVNMRDNLKDILNPDCAVFHYFYGQ